MPVRVYSSELLRSNDSPDRTAPVRYRHRNQPHARLPTGVEGGYVSRFTFLCASILALGCQGSDSIDGAGKIVRSSYTGSDTSWTLDHPQPSLYLFANQYYSVMYVPGEHPRAQWASVI